MYNVWKINWDEKLWNFLFYNKCRSIDTFIHKYIKAPKLYSERLVPYMVSCNLCLKNITTLKEKPQS